MLASAFAVGCPSVRKVAKGEAIPKMLAGRGLFVSSKKAKARYSYKS